MKVECRNLVFLLLILLISTTVCLAQDSTNVRIRRDNSPVLLSDVLIEQDGKKFLIIGKNETVEFLLEDGVKLESSNPNSVAVLNGNILVGINVGDEAVIIAKKDKIPNLKIRDTATGNFTVKVTEADINRQITAQSTYLPFKTVKDNFGKKFAQSFFVIQVDIRNDTLNKQFIVQTLDVIIDPNQCWNGRAIYEGFDSDRCISTFKQFFIFPTAQQSTRREEVLGTGKADLNRSRRSLGFRILAFSASMGTILTGFNGVLGPDGVKGTNVLGTTFTNAANDFIPNNSNEKLENLKNAVPTEDVIIKSKESKTFNIFIPTERVFYKKSWNEYIKPAKNSNEDTYALKAVLDLLLLSTATGVLVDNDAPKVQVKSDDNLQNQKNKFNIISGEIPKSFVDTSKEAVDVLDNLEKSFAVEGTRDSAVKKLRAIVSSLKENKDIEKFLTNEKVTEESGGKEIITGLRKIKGKILQDPSLEGKQDELVNKINETIVKKGK